MENNNLIIYGRNPVLEAINSNQPVNAVYILKGAKNLGEFVSRAKKAGIVVKEVAAEKLNDLSQGNRHGSVAAELSPVEYSDLAEVLADCETRSKKPFLLIADEIEDPHNLGALIRTAEAAGVDAVVIPKRRSAAVTGAVYAASQGAVAYVKIARVTNLTETIKDLKKRNIWVYGAETDGAPYFGADFSGGGGIALVIGSEGRGLGRLVRESCDVIVSLPMFGKINSLNASVCAGILMFHIAGEEGIIK
jgi:23S rRNA (guanosine2251-2'-O)-methyltransferase